MRWSSSGFHGVEWDVSSKREFLISPKWRNDSRNVFVLEQTRSDLEPGMFFPVSQLLESSTFSLLTPGSPCPEPATVLSLVFILQCFPVSPTWSNTQGFYDLQMDFLDDTEHSMPCLLQLLSLLRCHIQLGRCPTRSCLTRASTYEGSWHCCASLWRCPSDFQSICLFPVNGALPVFLVLVLVCLLWSFLRLRLLIKDLSRKGASLPLKVLHLFRVDFCYVNISYDLCRVKRSRVNVFKVYQIVAKWNNTGGLLRVSNN